MPSKSRYSRVIDASKQIARAAAIAHSIPTKTDTDRIIGVQSVLGQLRAAQNELEKVIEQCSLARGMYLSNPNIRNTITAAGDYLSARQPQVADLIGQVSDATESTDWQSIYKALTALAVDISGVSFDPATTNSV